MSHAEATYDYAIIGAGAAGLHLALAMSNDTFFHTKKILIVEPTAKNINDRTFCFWEHTHTWKDEIATKIWNRGNVYTKDSCIPLRMGDYIYKMVRSKNFYDYAKQRLQLHSHITWVCDSIQMLQEGAPCVMKGVHNTYMAHHVFDSRVEINEESRSVQIHQPFVGWIIKCKERTFEPDTYTMMDYRVSHGNECCFGYILPMSTNEALIEFTFFTPKVYDQQYIEPLLKGYIENTLGITSYEIIETESGSIPMFDYVFEQHHSVHITKIGTAGGWVKPSSGYSFINAERMSKKIIDNIKHGRSAHYALMKARSRWYDSILLHVLKHDNQRGQEIFCKLYARNSAASIFNFLDEQSSIVSELQLMLRMPWGPFLKALWHKYQ